MVNVIVSGPAVTSKASGLNNTNTNSGGVVSSVSAKIPELNNIAVNKSSAFLFIERLYLNSIQVII